MQGREYTRKKEAEKLAAKSSAGLSGLHAALNGSEDKVSLCL